METNNHALIDQPSKMNYLQKIEELQMEIVSLKDQNKIITQKYQSTKKERDELK